MDQKTQSRRQTAIIQNDFNQIINIRNQLDTTIAKNDYINQSNSKQSLKKT